MMLDHWWFYAATATAMGVCCGFATPFVTESARKQHQLGRAGKPGNFWLITWPATAQFGLAICAAFRVGFLFGAAVWFGGMLLLFVCTPIGIVTNYAIFGIPAEKGG